jgi:NADH:ubiquinone oxidoreductase subunit 6 (subunit J)
MLGLAGIYFSLVLYIVFSPNAIHALIALILLFINFGIVLFVTNNLFIGFAYVLVYIGAICVLFLYVIFLLHMRTYTLMDQFQTLILVVLIILFIAGIFWFNLKNEPSIAQALGYDISYVTELQLFTSYLFISHPHYMILAVMILVLALFLAIFLSTRFLIEDIPNEQ